MKSATILNHADKFLEERSPASLAVILILLVLIVGAVDHLTGSEISFSFFYLIPVCIGAWYSKHYLSAAICVFSALTWLALDYSSGNQYSHAAIPFWNASVRFGFFVVIAVLLEQLKKNLEFHTSLAQIDSLTGLLNARTFKQRCSVYFQLASRHKHPLALGYLDLDGFKGINDTFGHNVGDEVLRAIGAALIARLRASDIGARLGGDEFGILLPETDCSGAQAFFRQLHNSLLELAGVNNWPLGVSIGVAVLHSPPADPDEAIRMADALMYKVKNSGKNSIMFEDFGRTSGNTPQSSREDQLPQESTQG